MSIDIALSNLSLDYGDTLALKGITANFEAGKIHGLLGRNGSGKTSMMSVIAAYRRATSGSVNVDGRNPYENADIMSRICLIREGGDLVDTDKVSSALSFAARFRRFWDADFADRLIEKFELPLGKRINTLSRGKRSALAVVLGLASRAPLTMFDEVHLGMDAPSRYTFYEELLNDYLAHPRTIVLSTHLIEEVSSLLEEVTIIDNGQLVLQESVEDLRDRGVAVAGPASKVEAFVDELSVLSRRSIAGTLEVTTFGDVTESKRRQASSLGLQLGPVPLQDLFVHLTQKPEG